MKCSDSSGCSGPTTETAIDVTVQNQRCGSTIEQRWSERRDHYARLGVLVDGARIVDDFLLDLQTLRETEAETLLSLAAAAKISGYSTEHLARLVRQGILPNSGRKGRPLIARKDLPRKANSSLARGENSTYSAHADARSLRERQGER